MSHVLIVDDEPAICWGFQEFLTEDGHDVSIAASAEEALQLVQKQRPDAVVLDVRLPGMDGLTAISRLREEIGETPIIVITAFGNLETAVRAVQEGAFDYLPKPFDLGRAAELIERALNMKKVSAEIADEADDDFVSETADHTTLIGSSSAMQNVFKQIALVAATDIPVLITGESGTGKELVARAIHANGPRRSEPFVPICLPTFSAGVVESELFGHAKGSFTGADNERVGLLELAGCGTVMLDEIADAELALQVKLLRVLEQREIVPVGDARPRPIAARMIAATNRCLPEQIAAGTFREDLYFRLSVFQIHLPPLRERPDDIPLLVRHFLRLLGREVTANEPSRDVLDELKSRDWTGNVRELRNTIERAVVVSRGQPIQCEHLPPPMISASEPVTKLPESLNSQIAEWTKLQIAAQSSETERTDFYEQFLETTEPPMLQAVFDHCRQNRAATARLLGIHRTTLRQKLRKYGID